MSSELCDSEREMERKEAEEPFPQRYILFFFFRANSTASAFYLPTNETQCFGKCAIKYTKS